MKTKILSGILLFIFLSCKERHKAEDVLLITQQFPEIQDGLMKPETLWYFGRIGEFKISPDEKKVLFTVTFFDIQENRSNSEVFLISLETMERKQLTHTPYSESNISWNPDGSAIGFLYPDENEKTQLFEMDINGKNRRQISYFENSIIGFAYSPDMKNILYLSDVKKTPATDDLHPDMPKANARIIDELMYRHWDRWIDSYTHIFIAPYSNKITDGIDIMKDEPWESPVRPFGGLEQICWSPDGKTIVYTCRKLRGTEYSKSTNTDLYQYNIATGETVNLTEGMKGYDFNPVFSSDGRKLAWESMEREGYESDKHRLFILDITTGEKKHLLRDFEFNVYNITWGTDDEMIYFTTGRDGTVEIFSVNISDENLVQITEGIHNYVDIAVVGDKLLAKRHSMSKPDELYIVDTNSGEADEISFINKELLAQLRMGNVEKRMIKTTDNKEMLTWVIYPPNFDPGKKYPALLFCQGGPQSMVSQFWSYRWNFQLMAAHGYIVVAPNRRGVPGFGMEWLEQISKDYGGQNIRDYLSAIDELAKESYIDPSKLGACGPSYGGYSVFYLAGMHNKRFKAFIAHSGVFNFDSQYLETEELWFPDWDYGGPFWETNNPDIIRSYSASPHLMVKKWDTPILILHGERDYRVSYTQSLQAFNAAQILYVPSKLIIFPDENHWILKPQNAIVWQREFYKWLDKYLK